MNNKQRFENLQHGFYVGAGKYNIPQLIGSKRMTFPELIGFNYAKSAKVRSEKGLHFFLDDYQFLRLWNNPTAYLELIKQFQCVLTPDFSLYADFPVAMQIYNHYRKHWLGSYWEENGIEVIPTICWSDEKSFDWCFDGEHYKSKNPDVAVQLSRYIDKNPDMNASEILEYEGILIGMPYCDDDGIWRRWDTIITETQAQEIAQNEYCEE